MKPSRQLRGGKDSDDTDDAVDGDEHSGGDDAVDEGSDEESSEYDKCDKLGRREYSGASLIEIYPAT